MESLGPLENEIMEALWQFGPGNVVAITARLSRHLAYTTVMNTLARLYKKGLVDRRKASGRALVYIPRGGRETWERKRISDLLAPFLSGPASRWRNVDLLPGGRRNL